eukprot:5704153-Amphidinium_carterae.1
MSGSKAHRLGSPLHLAAAQLSSTSCSMAADNTCTVSCECVARILCIGDNPSLSITTPNS